jgi:hypothetical protein
MAENKPIDVSQLLKDATANAAAAKAAREAAKAAADKLKSSNAAEQRIKLTAQSRTKYAEGLQTSLDDDLVRIKQIVKDVTDSSGKITTAQERDLQFYSKRYNSTLTAQTTAYQEVKDLSAGKYEVDNSGKLKLKQATKPVGAGAGGGAATDSQNAARIASSNPVTTPRPKGVPLDATFSTPTGKWTSSTGTWDSTGKKIVAEKVVGDTGAKAGDTGAKVGDTGKVAQTPEQIAAAKVKSDAAAKVKADAAAAKAGTLTPKQQEALGTYGSKFLLDYFKTAENGKYKTLIYDKLITFAQQNADFDTVVAPYLRDTAWYKDVNQRTYSLIGAAAIGNGLKLDQATTDSYRDQILGKVKTIEEVSYDLRLKAISDYQLDTTKPDVARLMRAGQDFQTAASDFIDTYKKALKLSNSQFQISDQNFQTIFKSSTSLGDFDKKIKHSPQYLAQPDVQMAIASNITMVKTKYKQYGLSLTAEAAANLGQMAYLGDTSTEAIDENLRNEAVKLFPAFKDRIMNGESVLSIASPYIGAVQRILEIPEGSLDLEDPTIRKAMMGRTTTVGDKTSTAVTPLWEFEQNLYKDSRWQYTSNARQNLDSKTLDVFSRFGVIG